jgi:cysteine synthase A
LSPPARIAVHSRPRGWTSNAVRLIEADAHRRADTYFCDEWIKARELDTSKPAAALTEFERSGQWD